MNSSRVALALVMAASLAAIGVLTVVMPKETHEKNGPASVTVVIDFGGQTPTDAGPGAPVPWSINVTLENGTVFGALQAAASSANFTFISEWYPNFGSHRVNGIAGVRDGTDNRYWQYYVNGQYLDKGADLVGLSNGDVVKWEFRSALQ